MSVIAKIGFRTYEFQSEEDLSKAREIWNRPGSQDDFEDDLEYAGIQFDYAFFDEDI